MIYILYSSDDSDVIMYKTGINTALRRYSPDVYRL